LSRHDFCNNDDDDDDDDDNNNNNNNKQSEVIAAHDQASQTKYHEPKLLQTETENVC